MQYPVYVGESARNEAAHFVVSLMARRNASLPWTRVSRIEAFDAAEKELVEKQLKDRIERAKPNELVRDKEARSAEWQLVTVEYVKARRIRGWTVRVGRGKFRLSELGIGKKRKASND